MKKGNSFDRINYLLRPNKSIERKLVFEVLSRLTADIPLANHRYIGFGSMWFGDFILAHRILGLKDMWSIEDADHADRANFNRPYRTIEVKAGRSRAVFSEMSAEEWRQPSVIWLDYDGVLNDEVRDDIDLLARSISSPSVLILTVNAQRGLYRPQQAGRGGSRSCVDTVGSFLGTEALASVASEPNNTDFPKFLTESIINHCMHKMHRSGRYEGDQSLTFAPIFNFCHIDGAPMITIGGVICRGDQAAHLRQSLSDLCEFDGPYNIPRYRCLDLVQLTLREKAALDKILPIDDTAAYLAEAQRVGISLPETEIAKYRDCYRHFPVFAETLI